MWRTGGHTADELLLLRSVVLRTKSQLAPVAGEGKAKVRVIHLSPAFCLDERCAI
jgi:hypothetical protein